MTPKGDERTYFIDTSALLKAYISEEGTDALDAIFQEDAPRYISTMGLIEAISTFQRLLSIEGSLSRPQFEQLCARLLAGVASGRLLVSGVTSLDVRAALELEAIQYLTAVDATQIAIAKGLGGGVVFVSSDAKLNRVACEHGLRVLHPMTNDVL